MNHNFYRYFLKVLNTGVTLLVLSHTIKGQAVYKSPDNRTPITIFLIDGLSNEVFKELLSSEQLPTIDSLIHNGLYVENGIVSFPSMTGYGFYPFLTGMDATESGITGLRWFDRTRTIGNLRNYVGRSNVYMNEDFRKDVKTLFEYFPDEYTASVNSFCNRGVTESAKTGWALTTSKYGSDKLFGSMRKIPFIGKKISKNNPEHADLVLEKSLLQLKQNPMVHWITFPSPDGINHIDGTTREYKKAVIRIDSLIGDYIVTAKKINENRIYAVLSDHGTRDVSQNVRLEEELSKTTGLNITRGKSTMLRKMILDDPISLLDDYDGHLVINGNLSAYLYMKNTYWKEKNRAQDLFNYPHQGHIVNIPKALVAIPGIDMICYADDDDIVHLHNSKGISTIYSKGDSLMYRFIDTDILGYALGPDPILATGKYYHYDDLLQLTSTSNYPDAMYRVSKLFKATGAPDIVILSKKGYDLAKDYEIFVGNYKGGHGGLHRDLLAVPFILSGPTVTTEKKSVMRSEEFGRLIKEELELR